MHRKCVEFLYLMIINVKVKVLSSNRTKNKKDNVINKVSTGTKEKITLKEHESKNKNRYNRDKRKKPSNPPINTILTAC